MGELKPLHPAPSSAPARQELATWNAGDTAHFTVAIKDKLIRKSTQEEVKEVLRYAMMKLGLRGQNLPSEIEKLVILQHITLNYGGNTVEELKLAFDMAIARKLEVDPVCYENFSCEYISRIMSAYRKWAAQEFRELPTLPPPASEVKEDLSAVAMGEWYAEIVQRVKSGHTTFEYMPPMLYDYLDKRGDFKATNGEKHEYLQKAVAWREGVLMEEAEKLKSIDGYRALQEFRSMKNEGCFTGSEINRLKETAKKLLFFDHILKLAE